MGIRPHNCNHEDWPCCGCGDEPSQEEQREQWEATHALADHFDTDEEGDEDFDPEYNDGEDFSDEPEDNFTDVEADADTLASAGFGTDEDYGGGFDTPLGQEYGDGFDNE